MLQDRKITLILCLICFVSLTSATTVLDTKTFSSAPSKSNYTLPSNTEGINVTISGAEGGTGGDGSNGVGGDGGTGAKAKFQYKDGISGNMKLTVGVAEKGEDGEDSTATGSAGGGGGSSAIRYASNSSLIACAGGGGGGGSGNDGDSDHEGGTGGDGGNGDGQDGDPNYQSSPSAGLGGTGYWSGCGGGGAGGSGAYLDGQLADGEDGSPGSMDYHISNYTEFSTSSNTNDGSVTIEAISFNNLPKIDSKSVDPDPPQIGNDVSYTVNTSDSDGSISKINLTVYDDGSQVYTNTVNQADKTFSNVYQATAGSLDAYIKVTDNEGGTNSTWINRTLSDDAPTVTLNKPNNQSYFKYDVPVDFSVSDSDNEPSEDWNCDIDKDGSLYEEVYLKEGTNSSYTDTISSNKGTHSTNVSCTDGSGNSDSKSEDYTVKRYEIQSTSGTTPVFETTNQTFSAQVKTGSMVNNLVTSLYWNNSLEYKKSVDNSGVNTYNNDHYFVIPLIKNNNTVENWQIEAKINYSDFQSGTTSETSKNSSSVSQNIYYAYHTPKAEINRSKVVEKEDVDLNLTFTNELSPGKATKSGTLSFNTFTKSGFENSFDTPLIGSNNAKITKSSSGTLTLDYNNKTRDMSASTDSVDIHKKILTDCTNSVNGKTGDKALEFTLLNEENRSEKLTGDINYNFDVTHHGEHSRNYNFTNSGVKTSELCVYPAWADYNISGPLDYSSSSTQNSNNKKYPERDRRFKKLKINNQSESIDLYLLEKTLSTDVLFKVIDSGSDPINDVNIKTMRYFTGLNSFITVTNVRTDSNGEAPTKLKEDITYKYILTKNGQVLEDTSKSKLSCSSVPCTKTFQIGNTVSPYFKVEEGFSYKVEKLKDKSGNVTGLEATVSHRSGVIDNASFNVEKLGVIGWENKCNLTTSSSGQAQVCQFNNTLEGNTYKYVLKGSKDGFTYTLTTGTLSDGNGLFGKSNPWAAAMIFLVITGIGIRSPKTSIAFSTAGAVTAWWLGLISVSITAIASLVIVAALVMATGES